MSQHAIRWFEIYLDANGKLDASTERAHAR